MYWISTSDSLFRILRGDFHNPLWREHFGFANLNGAKFLYGAGLLFAGYSDTSELGHGAGTYYIWKDIAGQPLPRTHTQYPLLRYARLYSSIYTVGGIVLVFLSTVLLTGSLFAGSLASAVVIFHPVTLHIATHSFADDMFLFFQMLLFYFLLLGLRSGKTRLIDVGIGATLAWLISVKMNGFLFLPIIMLMCVPTSGLNNVKDANLYAGRLLIIGVSAISTFLLLHPNFFFYPSYSFMQIYRDRIRITMHHIAYFSVQWPGHVTLPLPMRLASLVRHVFRDWTAIVSLIAAFPFLYGLATKKITRIQIYILAAFLMMVILITAYTVFDEQRYYYPLVPFLAIFIGMSAQIALSQLKRNRASDIL